MASIPDNIIVLVKKIILELEKRKIHIQKAILFGSYAKGNFNEWSDIDLALVSRTFEGIRIKDRSKIRKIVLAVSAAVEPLPFRPEDFTVDNPLVKEIIDTGIVIV